MSIRTHIVFGAVVGGLLSALGGSAFALGAEDEAKLRELEQAMQAPVAPPAIVKKPRTRAIVFDNEPAQAAAPAAEVKPTRVADCAAIPADARTVQVDFAIQFKAGSAEVAATSEDTLRQISKILALSPDRCVLIEGHSDSSGNLDMNMALSRDRASSVVRFIVEKAGMDRSRLISVGKGPTEPLKNLDARDARNRRVVFKVVG